MNIFIYGLNCPLAGTIRYVGKSDDPVERLRGHLNGAASYAYEHHTARWLRKLIKAGTPPTLVILHQVQDGERWQDAERRIIASAPERGWWLTNSTAGGEGLDFLREEDAHKYRANLSAAMKKTCATPEWRQAQSERSKRNHANDAYVEKRRASLIAAHATPATKAKMAAVRAEVCARPEVKAARSVWAKHLWSANREAMLAATTTPAVKAIQSAKRKAAWADPVTGAKLRAAAASSEKRARLAETAKRRATPEYRAMMAERTRLSWEKRRAA